MDVEINFRLDKMYITKGFKRQRVNG